MTEYRRPLDLEDHLDIQEVLAGDPIPFGMSIEARRQAALEIDTRDERESGVTVSAESLAARLEVSVEQVQQWREEFAAPSEDRYVSRGMSWIEAAGSLRWDGGDITFEWSPQPRRENGTIQARPVLNDIYSAVEAAWRAADVPAAMIRPQLGWGQYWRVPADYDLPS